MARGKGKKTEIPQIGPEEIPAEVKVGFEQIYALDREVATLKAQHIDPVAKKKTGAWRMLKARTGFERADLDLWYRIYKRYREALAMDDQHDAERIQRTMKAVYQAVAEGETIDWLKVLTEADADTSGLPDVFEGDTLAAGAGGEDDDADDDDEAAEARSSDTETDGAERRAGSDGGQIDGPEKEWTPPPALGSDDEFLQVGDAYNQGLEAGLSGTPLVNAFSAETERLQFDSFERGFRAGIERLAAQDNTAPLTMPAEAMVQATRVRRTKSSASAVTH